MLIFTITFLTGGSNLLAQSNLQNSAASATNSNRCGAMYQQQGLDGAKRPSLAAEVVSDCGPRTSMKMDCDATPSKESSEQQKMETVVLQSEDSVADRRTGLFHVMCIQS